MSGGRPLVSVVMAVYNNATYVAEAIDSAMAQVWSPLEIVVIDDGSDDGTSEVLRGYGDSVSVVTQSRGGIGAARNRGVEVSQGHLITFLDADDRLVPHTVERQAEVLLTDDGLDAVYAHVREFVSPELSPQSRARLRAPNQRIPGRLPTQMLIRRPALNSVGAFSTELRRGVTLDWTARAVEKGLRSVVLDDVLFERRLHLSNNGLRESDSTGDYVRVLKAALDRRRAAGPVP